MPIRLAVGSTNTCEVPAHDKRVRSDLLVSPGDTYEISATGTWCDTHKHCCSADGYASTNLVLKASERLRRVPDARWFTLIAAVEGHEKHAVPVGAAGRFDPPAQGPLIFFANDVPFMYFNNSGSVMVTVTRIR